MLPAAQLDMETCPRRCDVKEFEEDGEVLLYHPLRDEATVLNQSAAEVWQLCDGKASLEAITTRLGARYGVEGTLLFDDVVTALLELSSRELIELA
ncbi:MAG: PqqD family protein [Thermodesulfobacteriota bacterium]